MKIYENPEEIFAKTYPKMRKWLLLTKKLQKRKVLSSKFENAGNEIDTEYIMFLNLKENFHFRK
jgi:hypothetical protein